MGFFSGMGRGLRGAMNGAAGTQALLAGDHGAYGRMRGQQARLRTAQGAMEEERRQALIGDLLGRGLDPAQAELALANPDFARQFGAPGLVGAVVHAASQDGFDRSSEIAIAQQRARETGRDYRDILREMRGLPPRPQAPGPAEAGMRQVAKPPAPSHNRAEEDRVFRAKLGQDGLNGFGYVPSESDVNLMARSLYSEFGETGNWEDMWAGAWSIVNRVRPRGQWPAHRGELGRTLGEVIFKRGRNGVMQYSFAPPGGTQAPGGSRGWRESAMPERLTGDSRKAWDVAVLAAREVLGGAHSDPTGGSTYFHNEVVGSPESVGGFFGGAYRGEGGRRRTLGLSPYRSPSDENFFYHDLTEPPQPVLSKQRRFPISHPDIPVGGN